MTPSSPLVWVDVFAEAPLSGNPLAVIDGAAVPEEQLLPLARELCLSETTFIYPPAQGSSAHARVRIFTQAQEIPFAGHPILGTAVALVLLGWVPFAGGESEVRLVCGLGEIAVTLRGGAAPERARLRHRHLRVPGEEVRDERLAWLQPALGLVRDQIGATVDLAGGPCTLMPQVVSGGALQLIVPLRTPADVDGIRASYGDVVVAERALGAELGMLAFAFASPPPRDGQGPVEVRARCFAHDAPLEDPATGSAAAALAVYLHHHGLLRPGQEVVVDQGPPRGLAEDIPGRRGLLRAACDGQTVEVEGRVRPVLRGGLVV